MCVEIQHIFRYLSENMLNDRDETPPLGASLPSTKPSRRRFLHRRQREAAQTVRGFRIGPRRGVSTEGVSRLNTVISKVLETIHVLGALVGEQSKLD